MEFIIGETVMMKKEIGEYDTNDAMVILRVIATDVSSIYVCKDRAGKLNYCRSEQIFNPNEERHIFDQEKKKWRIG